MRVGLQYIESTFSLEQEWPSRDMGICPGQAPRAIVQIASWSKPCPVRNGFRL